MAIGLGDIAVKVVRVVHEFQHIALRVGGADDDVTAAGFGPEVDAAVQVADDGKPSSAALPRQWIFHGMHLAAQGTGRQRQGHAGQLVGGGGVGAGDIDHDFALH